MSKKEKQNAQNLKHKTLVYTLPLEGNTITVCKQMFIGTISLSERFVRTTMEKLNENGILGTKKRDCRSHTDVDLEERERIKNIWIIFLEWSRAIVEPILHSNTYLVTLHFQK